MRVATSAWKRPAWSRLAKLAREIAAIIEIMAQTITNSIIEKPVWDGRRVGPCLRCLRCLRWRFDIVVYVRRLESKTKKPLALGSFPEKMPFLLGFHA
jgi:hypothetical protein